MSKINVVAIFLMVLVACRNGSPAEERKDGFSETAKSPEDSLFQLVMNGHNIGMGKMGKIRAYLNQAKSGLDSIGKLKLSPETEIMQQAFMDIQEDLNYAEYGMNQWMEEFNSDSAVGNTTARIQYLESEKVKVEKVKENILSALQRADSLFKK